jgi:drug/metabolite transporter (DMT)-like permease
MRRRKWVCARYGADVASARTTSSRSNLVVLGYILVFASAALAAFNVVFARLIIDTGVEPLQLSATRIYGGGLVFLIPVLGRIRRSHLLPIAAFGVIGLVLGQGTAFIAFQDSDVAIVLVIIFTAPIFVTLYERVHLAATLPVYAYAAIVVAIGGVALAVAGGGIGGITVRGLLFATISMIAYGVSVILAARLPTDLPPLARTAASMVAAAVAFCVIVPPWTLPVDLLGATASFTGGLGFSMPLWVAIAFAILIGSVGVFVAWVAGTSLVGAGASSVVGMAEPVLAAAVAWALLGQYLTGLQMAGIGLTVSAILVVEAARIRTRRIDAPDAPVEL